MGGVQPGVTNPQPMVQAKGLDFATLCYLAPATNTYRKGKIGLSDSLRFYFFGAGAAAAGSSATMLLSMS